MERVRLTKLLLHDRKIQAIKALRQASDLTLRDCKEITEEVMDGISHIIDIPCANSDRFREELEQWFEVESITKSEGAKLRLWTVMALYDGVGQATERRKFLILASTRKVVREEVEKRGYYNPFEVKEIVRFRDGQVLAEWD